MPEAVASAAMLLRTLRLRALLIVKHSQEPQSLAESIKMYFELGDKSLSCDEPRTKEHPRGHSQEEPVPM